MSVCVYLKAHGHGSGLFVCTQLHRLHGCCSFTMKSTFVQDGVKHLRVMENKRRKGDVKHTIQPFISDKYKYLIVLSLKV